MRSRIVLATLLVIGACGLIPTAGEPTEGDLEARGRVLYEQTCMACHGGATGGSMMDYPPPHNSRGHTWHHGDCELRQIIEDGSGPRGEEMRRMMGVPPDAPTMPPFRDVLSDEDIDAVLAFIKTMWTQRQRDFQETVTQQVCE